MGVIGEQANAADAEIGQNLAAQADLSQRACAAVLAFARALLPLKEDAVRLDGAVDPEAACAVVQIDQGATARRGDDAQRLVDQAAVVRAGQAEDILSQGMSVDAHRDGLVGGHIADHQRHMRLAMIHLVLVRDHAEVAVRRGQHALPDALNGALML